MNIITTEQLISICLKAASNGYTKPSCGAACLGVGENLIDFAEALFRAQPGDCVHISKGAMGQDSYEKLAATADDGLPLWETRPQQYAEDFAEEMLRHHG